MTHPSEHCWKEYELSEDELEVLWLYEKHKTPPEADASCCMFCLTVVPEVFVSLILIVTS